jgi:hypothetical protein
MKLYQLLLINAGILTADSVAGVQYQEQRVMQCDTMLDGVLLPEAYVAEVEYNRRDFPPMTDCATCRAMRS